MKKNILYFESIKERVAFKLWTEGNKRRREHKEAIYFLLASQNRYKRCYFDIFIASS